MSCIDKILDAYKTETRVLKRRMLFSNILIHLMRNLDEGVSSFLEVRNCLILAVNLFEPNKDSDHYTTKGKSPTELSEVEKGSLFDLLRLELDKAENN